MMPAEELHLAAAAHKSIMNEGFNPIAVWNFRRIGAVMRSTQQLSITLPVEMARLIKDRVASGAYASESEVIREGLRALQEREDAVEKWLREEVAPAYDRHKANPERSKPLAEAASRVQHHMDSAARKVR
jgi:putative addiction module CopG family antidote